MTRTVQDYAGAIPLGRVASPDHVVDIADVTIVEVTTRDEHVVATLLWDDYPHLLSHALAPDDVLVMGGHVPADEAELDEWAESAVVDLVWAAEMPLLASRRTSDGSSIEITASAATVEAGGIALPDPRFVSGHLAGTDPEVRWAEVARHADPRVPPPVVERWRSDGTLISWHHVTVADDHVMPVLGHGAVRWVADGVASIDLLDLSPGLPATFGVLTVAEAARRAAAAGTGTIVCTVDAPGLDLLGFRDRSGSLQIDDRFLHIDHEGLADLVATTVDWTPPDHVRGAMERNRRTTYYAG